MQMILSQKNVVNNAPDANKDFPSICCVYIQLACLPKMPQLANKKSGWAGASFVQQWAILRQSIVSIRVFETTAGMIIHHTGAHTPQTTVMELIYA